jgi:hypothetical protein
MIFAIALILFSCAKKKTTEEAGNASQFLPEKVLSAGLERAPGIRIFSGDSLWEYIDGGAELYHQYNFAEVAIAEYKGDKVELVADIYRFDNATDAYGIYSILRPEKPNIVIMGVEGFSASAAIVFVKGAYLVKVFAYEDSESSNKAMVGLAQELNNQIPGASNRPNSFLLFPVNNRIGARDKYFRESFLGQKFLRRFYTQEYLFGADTVTLFLSHDEAGEKYLKWSEYAVSLNRLEPASDSLGYDSAKAFIINDNLSGLSIAGLKKGKLIGMLKYNDTHRQFLVDWVNSFQ